MRPRHRSLVLVFTAMALTLSALAIATTGSAEAWPRPAGPSAQPYNETFWSSATHLSGDDSGTSPITITNEVRRPLIYFRQVANRRWKVGALFGFLFCISAALKLFLPRLTEAATSRCQKNFFASLSSAFIFSTVTIAVVRFSFLSDALSAMGLFTFGFLQLSFALGACFGVNVLAQNLYQNLYKLLGKISGKSPESFNAAARTALYALCLLSVVTILCLVSMIPDLGPLPRLGNRMVMLIAALGLGGLVNLLAVSSQKVEP